MTKEIRVLLIDDDEDDFVMIRDLIREIKGSTVYHMDWKSDFESGLKSLIEGSFDICLLDYRLGEYNGLEILSTARQKSVTAPMILLTGYGDAELDFKAMKMGASDYLVKEKLNAHLLERSIRYALKHSQDLHEVQEQKENFHTLFNSTFEGIIVYKDGLIKDINAAACRIFGKAPEQMIEHSLLEFIQPDVRDEFDRQVLAKSDNVMESIALRGSDETSIEAVSKFITLQGESTLLIAIRDLSQRKQMEAQILRQDRLASLGLLASSLAHEIGTPLGIIRGRAQFISDKAKDEKIKQDMGLITSQIDKVAKLVNSLLHLAREKKSSVKVPVDVVKILDDVVRLVQHEIDRNQITLIIDKKGTGLVQAEPGPLGQVFLNLIVNSFHAIEEARQKFNNQDHRITITVNDDGDLKTIAFTDTGCGIEDKNIKNIFKPFFTTKDVGTGTGLGLATSFKIIQSWGGSIDVSSKVGQGTSFTIKLRSATL